MKPHAPGDIIRGYRVVTTLGRGGLGTTYEAVREATGEHVALKRLAVAHVAEWKHIELFEREAAVLARLQHPAIPRYIEHFTVDPGSEAATAGGASDGESPALYIAEELVAGKSLAEIARVGGVPMDEPEVRRIAEALLDVLAYLGRQVPPVIHRDIKPENILRRPDGRIALVDFGAARAELKGAEGGSTTVGTYGYMAPEQLHGVATPATDIYGLACTLLFLLTGRPPTDLPRKKLQIDFEAATRGRVTAAFASWLKRALEPAMEDRFASAMAALTALRGSPATGRRGSTRVVLAAVAGVFLVSGGAVVARLHAPDLATTESQAFSLPTRWAPNKPPPQDVQSHADRVPPFPKSLVPENPSMTPAESLYHRSGYAVQTLARQQRALDAEERTIRDSQQSDPTNAWYFLALARLTLQRGHRGGDDYDQDVLTRADAFVDQALAASPNLGEAHVQRAWQLYFAKDDARARDEAVTAERLDTAAGIRRTGRAELLLGELGLKRGDLEEAETAGKRAVEVGSPGQIPLGYRLLVRVYRARGDFAAAGVAYQQLVVADPNDGAAHAELAAFLYEAGQYDRAIEAARRAIELNNSAEAHHTLAEAYSERGAVKLWELKRPEAARTDFESAIASDGTYGRAHYGLAACLRVLALEQNDRALLTRSSTELDRAARLESLDADRSLATRARDENVRLAARMTAP
jgi:serine/threonine protein kinase/Tfp pilus assembly protein PilF